MKDIKVFEAFAGIGAQHKALKNLKDAKEIESFEIVAISEWDMWANIAYEAIHHNDNTEILNLEEKEKLPCISRILFLLDYIYDIIT